MKSLVLIKTFPYVSPRAYMRLKEVNCAYSELKSYYEEATDKMAVERNIVALSEDFLQGGTKNGC